MSETATAANSDEDSAVKIGKKAVARLFRASGIARVVVVDDDYNSGVDVDLFISTVASRSFNSPALLESLGLPLDRDADNWLDRATESVARWTEEERIKRFRSVLPSGPLFPDRIAELAEDFQVLQLSPNGWEREKQHLIAEAEHAERMREGRTLFLFDIELGPDAPRGFDGLKFVQELRNALSTQSLLCGVLSARYGTEKEAGAGVEYQAENLVYLSKKRLSETPETFAEGLARTLIEESVSRMITAAVAAIGHAHETAKDQLRALNVNNFERIIHHVSNVEGISELETLLRVYSLYHRKEARRRIRIDGPLLNAVDTLRDVASTIKFKAAPPSDEAKRLQAQEMYEDGQDINLFHLPVELGDIFEIRDRDGETHSYVLLGQPCDLSLRMSRRANASEARRKLEMPWLARIVSQAPRANALFAHSELPYASPDYNSAWVDFRSARPADMRILDLVVFDREGVAKIATDRQAPPGLLPAWAARYEELRSEFRSRVETVRDFQAFLARVEENGISVPPTAREQIILHEVISSVADPELIDATVRFACKRVRRILQPHAGVLLIRFTRYSSREAFDVDLAS